MAGLAVQVPLVMLMAFLVCRQALCIAGNLTINELLNSHRYDYMRRDDDTFYNRFDRGPAANCLQFWRSPQVAWDDMYHQERLVRRFSATETAIFSAIENAEACVLV